MISSGPLDGATIVDVAPTLAFSANERATFSCSVDGGAALPCASPFTTLALPAGSHTIAVTATDAVGNVDPTPATRTFTVATGLATLVDADRDGLPEVLDCNDHDAAVRPGGLEVPGNRVDENCDGVVAPFPRITALISVSGIAGTKTTTFRRLLVTGVPKGGAVELRCSGAKMACPFARRSLRVSMGKANGLALLSRKRRKRGLTFRVGATVEVRVTALGMIGKVRRLRVLKRTFPRGQDLCLSPTGTTRRSCDRPARVSGDARRR